MGLFSFFRKTNEANMDDQQNPYKESTQNSNNNKVDANDNVTIVNIGTGYPIDVVYSYLRKNFDNQGYDDAMANHDASYMNLGKLQIENHLRVLFKQVTQKYNDEIVRLEPIIDSTRAMLMADHAAQLESRLRTYKAHIAEIDKLKQNLDNKTQEMTTMLMSYERGFQRGMAAIIDGILNNLNTHGNEEQ
mgnify:CR=1 FL=1